MKFLSVFFCLCLASCASTQTTTYEAIGGQKTIATIVDNFIEEIQFDEKIFPYFKESNVDRFRSKLNEHLCVLTQGPCKYTGDAMKPVHTGMKINESDFNLTVELFIKAMEKANVSYQHQNKILREMAKLRGEIIYL